MKEYIRTDNLKNQYYGKKKKKIIRKKIYNDSNKWKNNTTTPIVPGLVFNHWKYTLVEKCLHCDQQSWWEKVASIRATRTFILFFIQQTFFSMLLFHWIFFFLPFLYIHIYEDPITPGLCTPSKIPLNITKIWRDYFIIPK